MRFHKLALAALIGAVLAGCGEKEDVKPASREKQALQTSEAGVQRLTPAPLQEDKSVYWAIGGGAEIPFIYFGKTQGAGSIADVIPRMHGVRSNSGDETLELLRAHGSTSDAFAKADIESKLLPQLTAKVQQFAEHDFYKLVVPPAYAHLTAYDVNAQAFPVESTLFSSLERQKQVDSDKSRYTSESEKYFLYFTDSKGFRLGFINGEQMRSIKVPQDLARAVEAARSGGHILELHVYGSPAMTTLSYTAQDKQTRTVLLEGQYVEIVDRSAGGKVIYGGAF